MDAGRITAMIHSSAAKTMTIAQSPSASRSPWHSPVPYLFGGLAAMLGLIAFALLILACSYWRLSGYLEGGDRDLEAGEGSENGGGDEEMKKTAKPVFEEKFLVIMAGQQKPTCLATPMSSRASSFGSTSTSSSSATGTSTGSRSTVCTCTTVDGENDNEEGSTHMSQVEMETMGSSTNQTDQAHQVS